MENNNRPVKNRKKKAVRILKRRIRRYRFLILFFAMIAICLTAGIFIGTKASDYIRSESVNDYGRHKTYTVYTVEPGETLWSIAEDLFSLNPEYNDIRQYMAAIQTMNKISGENLKSGQTLLIPYYTNDGNTEYQETCQKYGIRQ